MKNKVVKTTPPKGGNVIKNVFFSVIMLIVVGFGYYAISYKDTSHPIYYENSEALSWDYNETSLKKVIENDSNLSDYINKSNDKPVFMMAFKNYDGFNIKDCYMNDVKVDTYFNYTQRVNDLFVFVTYDYKSIADKIVSDDLKIVCNIKEYKGEWIPKNELRHTEIVRLTSGINTKYSIYAYDVTTKPTRHYFDDADYNKDKYQLLKDVHKYVNNNDLLFTKKFYVESKPINNYGYYTELMLVSDSNNSDFSCGLENKSLDSVFGLHKTYTDTQIYLTNKDTSLIRLDKEGQPFDDGIFEFNKINCLDSNNKPLYVKFGGFRLKAYKETDDEYSKYFIYTISYIISKDKDPSQIRSDYSFKRWYQSE